MHKVQSIFVAVALSVLGLPGVARAELVFGSTSNGRVISFDSATPGTLLSNVAITNVVGTLVGIDFRPLNRLLYALGNNGGVGTVYTIDTNTGVATSVYTLTSALSGTSFGVDFNPVPDALRIVSDTNQNLRITGFPTNTFVTNTDAALSLTGVTAAAYINNNPGVTTTTLFDIRSTDSSLYTQIPPNNGTLNLVGALGTTTNSFVGFDVSGRTGIAYASLNGGSNFGTVNLTTGAFTNIGSIGGGLAGQVTGISVQSVPESGSIVQVALALLLCCTLGMFRSGLCVKSRSTFG